MSDAIVLAVLSAMTGLASWVGRGMVVRIKSLEEIGETLREENTEIRLLYAALYYDLYGGGPEPHSQPERPPVPPTPLRRSATERRAGGRPAIDSAADAATSAELGQRPDWLP